MRAIGFVVPSVTRWLALELVLAGTMTAQEPTKHGTITGTVVDHNGTPIRKATITLDQDDQPQSGTTTNEAGQFTLQAPLGNYNLTARRDGYVTPPNKKTQVVTLTSDPTTATIILLPTSAITGRVTDNDGDPIMRASVIVTPWHRKKIQRPQEQSGSSAATDDHGEYRAYHLAPGDYTIAVTAHPPSERTPGLKSRGTYPTTYYPGTTDPGQAGIIRVQLGSDASGIDVQLTPAYGVTISGRVTGGPPRALFIMVYLAPRSGQRFGQSWDALVDRANGTFTLHDVLPGEYRAHASYKGENGARTMSARQDLTVGQEDINDLHLHLQSPSTVTGRITTPPGRTIPGSVIILLGSKEPGDNQGGGFAAVSAPGPFRMTDVPLGEYQVIVLAEQGGDLYVDRIRLGATDVLTDGLQVAVDPVGPVEITFAPGGITNCTVTNPQGQPAVAAHVIFLPNRPYHTQVARYRQCTTDPNGQCTITGIAPGTYHAIAFPGQPDVDFRDPTTHEQLQRTGKPITIKEAAQTTITLRTQPEE